MKKQSVFIIVSVLILAVIMNVVDILKPQYFIKSIIKLTLFLLIPLIYFLINKNDAKQLKKLFTPNKKDLFPALLIGALCYSFILAGYYILKKYIDFSGVTKSLTTDIGVNAENFIYVSTYISLCNSFLEEFFFRGFAFITLKKYISTKAAYLFSSFVFAIYHIGMTLGWVEPLVFAGGFIGLFIGGIIFNYLNEKKNNIYTSWIVHMFINFAINTVGFILFGVL